MARDRFLQLSIGLTIAVPASLAHAQEGHEQDTHAQDSHAVDAHGDDTHGAHASHEPVGAIPSVKQGVVTGITAVIVFLVVAGVLGAKVWPTISKGLDERASKIKGEIAVVISPPAEEAASEADAEELLKAALARLPAGKAAAEVARITGRERQELFRLALSFKEVPADGGGEA